MFINEVVKELESLNISLEIIIGGDNPALAFLVEDLPSVLPEESRPAGDIGVDFDSELVNPAVPVQIAGQAPGSFQKVIPIPIPAGGLNSHLPKQRNIVIQYESSKIFGYSVKIALILENIDQA